MCIVVRKHMRLLVIAILAMGCFISPVHSSETRPRNTLKLLEEKIQDVLEADKVLETNLLKIQQQITEASSMLASAERRIKEAHQAVSEARVEFNKAQKSLKSAIDRRDTLLAKHKAAHAKTPEMHKRLEAQIAAGKQLAKAEAAALAPLLQDADYQQAQRERDRIKLQLARLKQAPVTPQSTIIAATEKLLKADRLMTKKRQDALNNSSRVVNSRKLKRDVDADVEAAWKEFEATLLEDSVYARVNRRVEHWREKAEDAAGKDRVAAERSLKTWADKAREMRNALRRGDRMTNDLQARRKRLDMELKNLESQLEKAKANQRRARSR